MARLDDKLAALATMSPAQLRDEWRAVTKSEPPRFAPDLLRRALGHRIQENELGALPAAALRRLRRLAGGEADVPTLKPGTRLMRSWHGRTIIATVTDAGFEYGERPFSSLTAIAREVTGAAWSGPRFFGLQAGQGMANG